MLLRLIITGAGLDVKVLVALGFLIDFKIINAVVQLDLQLPHEIVIVLTSSSQEKSS